MPVMPHVRIFYVTSNGRIKTILRYYPIKTGVRAEVTRSFSMYGSQFYP